MVCFFSWSTRLLIPNKSRLRKRQKEQVSHFYSLQILVELSEPKVSIWTKKLDFKYNVASMLL